MTKLIIAGTGIKYLSHLTYQTKIAIKSCTHLMFLVHDPATKHWLKSIKPSCQSLDEVYYSFENRETSYEQISSLVIDASEKIDNLLFLIYGHPTIFSSITSKIIEKAKNRNIETETYPGISALDCLFSDLNIDPGDHGMQSFEATELILYNHIINPYSHMIIWQPAVIGQLEIIRNELIDFEKQKIGISLLRAQLETFYSPCHPVYIYEASNYPGVASYIKQTLLSKLECEVIPRLSTLYIPPVGDLTKNIEAFRRLGLEL